MKKLLTALLIGAFVFGTGAVNIQIASANQKPLAEMSSKPTTPPNHDSSDRPEPPKDANGKPMAPPNHDGDRSDTRR